MKFAALILLSLSPIFSPAHYCFGQDTSAAISSITGGSQQAVEFEKGTLLFAQDPIPIKRIFTHPDQLNELLKKEQSGDLVRLPKSKF